MKVQFGMLMVVGGLLLGACGPSPMDVRPERLAERGESCTTRNDCGSGLLCVGGTCVLGDYPIDPNAQVCELVQCSDNLQCVLTAQQQCPELAEACINGDEISCDLITESPECNRQYRCEEQRCLLVGGGCQTNDDCPMSAPICQAGACLECLTNDDCMEEEQCRSNRCEPSCLVDLDCPLFHSCDNRVCVERPCATDRECVAFTGRVFATCDGDTGECLVPCNSDRDCSSAEDFQFEVCRSGRCTYVGCSTDEECRVATGLTSDDFLHPTRIVCRPPTNAIPVR